MTKERREKWIDQVKQVSSLMQKMEEGSLKMVHPEWHSWRDKSDNANIYVRKHMTSKDRADLAEF